MSDYVSLEALKKPSPRKEVDVEVPALGGKVRIRACSVTQRTRYERMCGTVAADALREHLICEAVVKPEGLTKQDVKVIAEHDGAALEPIINAIMDLWSIRSDPTEAIEKNSETTVNSGG